ncbi:MAG: DUF2141 domain-containing protein [Saprospiraceae bacterium]
MYQKLMLSVWLFCGCATISLAQINLNLAIENLEKPDGKLLIGFFGPNDEYLAEGACSICKEVVVNQEEKQVFEFNDIPPGEYSIAILHDLNDNNAMDFSWIGIPKEGYGFSNNPKKVFRRPTYDETKVSLTENADLTIKLVNW